MVLPNNKNAHKNAGSKECRGTDMRTWGKKITEDQKYKE